MDECDSVSIAIRVCGNSARITRVAATPSMSGIRVSMRITSGRARRALSQASIPVRAWPTTRMSLWREKTVVRPSRYSFCSSTRSSRIGPSAGTSLFPLLLK